MAAATFVSFTSIADLRSNINQYPSVFVNGYASAGDGGEGVFVFFASGGTSAQDNKGTIIVDNAGNIWHRAGQSQRLSVKWFGATGNGSTDDTIAVQNALAAAQALVAPIPGGVLTVQKNNVNVAAQIYYTGVDLYFPSGRYLLSATINITSPAINVVGDGPSQSVIYRTANYGDTFSVGPSPYATVPPLEGNCFTDLAMFAAFPNPTAGAHIHLTGCFEAKLSGLRLMGSFGGIRLTQCSDVRIDSIRMGLMGFGVLSSAAWTTVPTGSYFLTIENSTTAGYFGQVETSTILVNNFEFQGSGSATANVQNGIVITGCDVAAFSNGYCGQVYEYGLLIQPGSATAFIDDLFFSNIEFDGNASSSSACVLFGNPNGASISNASFSTCSMIASNTGLWAWQNSGRAHSVVNCYIAGNKTLGMQIVDGEGWLIADNQIVNNNTSGGGTNLAIGNNVGTGTVISGITITGNTIGQLAGGGGTAASGLVVVGPVAAANIQGNSFIGNTANIVNQTNLGSASIVVNNMAD